MAFLGNGFMICNLGGNGQEPHSTTKCSLLIRIFPLCPLRVLCVYLVDGWLQTLTTEDSEGDTENLPSNVDHMRRAPNLRRNRAGWRGREHDRIIVGNKTLVLQIGLLYRRIREFQLFVHRLRSYQRQPS